MTLPNFLVIGAIKGGTTSLYHYLKQHPQIYLSPIKEARFFAVEFDQPMDTGFNRFAPVKDLESYCALFEQVTDEKAIGEVSPQYLCSPVAAANIKAHIPDAKLIAVLRNPVDRAYSSFMHHVRDGAEPLTNFADALAAEPDRIQQQYGPLWHYKQAGFYYEQLQRYYACFDSSQIKIYLYEDLRHNLPGVLQEIFQFLEVDPNFMPDTRTKHNVSGVPQNAYLHQTLSKRNPAYRALRSTLNYLPQLKSSVKESAVLKAYQRWVDQIKTQNLVKPVLSDELRVKLTQAYRTDILQVQDLIHRDLSHWLI